MTLFQGEYSSELNSEDKLNPEIAMAKHKATGGTMVLWKRSLDKYISIHPVECTGFLPVVYNPPGSPISIHIALYLPTSGRDIDFIDQITQLSNCIDDLNEKYQDCLIFLRGDANVNKNNHDRVKIFSTFLSSHNLVQISIEHKTYHHFLGGGAFDSNIDILAHSKESLHKESVSTIFCKHDYPEIDSHHDPILSSVLIPVSEPTDHQTHLQTAPSLKHPRFKIIWSEDGIAKYQEEVASKLAEIRIKWLNPLSKTSLSILLSRTNDILSKTAISTNRSVNLNKVQNLKSKKKSQQIKNSETLLRKANKNLTIAAANNDTTKIHALQKALKQAHKTHRYNQRVDKNNQDNIKNEKLFTILSSNPSSAFSLIKSAKSSTPAQVPFITVGEKKYVGERVVDGLFESISKLKTLDSQQLAASPYHTSMIEDYENIKYLCSHKFDLPSISMETSSAIIHKMKPSVNDFFSITPRHFIHAGTAGLVHFNLLLNSVINDVNNSSVEELNSVYALLLYKGHNKDRTLDSSYRTISTCPLLAKSLDMYVRGLCIERWNGKQAETQYQGEGSSHELASLLITEAIQFSKFNNKKPIFLLFLDAKSAFDTVIIPYLVRCLYSSGMEGNSVMYMMNRLANRITFCEFNKVVTGPIYDQQGLEQGGVSSSDCYKLYNNDSLIQAQASNLGVEMGGSLVLSAVGQADDTVLLSNDLQKLNHITSTN